MKSTKECVSDNNGLLILLRNAICDTKKEDHVVNTEKKVDVQNTASTSNSGATKMDATGNEAQPNNDTSIKMQNVNIKPEVNEEPVVKEPKKAKQTSS